VYRSFTGAIQLTCHKNVFPPIGLTNLPFRAAFISAYRAGLIPFFLHFLRSASLSVVVSKLLDFHSLLDCDCWDAADETYPTSDGRPEEIVGVELHELVRCDCWSNSTVFSISRCCGITRGSRVIFGFNLRSNEAVEGRLELLGGADVVEASEMLPEELFTDRSDCALSCTQLLSSSLAREVCEGES
jgi:hypothetical protein